MSRVKRKAQSLSLGCLLRRLVVEHGIEEEAIANTTLTQQRITTWLNANAI